MRIEVKGKDPIKAYRSLMKKLDNDGLFKKLKDKRYHMSKSQKRAEKHKRALLMKAKLEKKKEQNAEKEEKYILIEAKKRAKQYKQQMKLAQNQKN